MKPMVDDDDDVPGPSFPCILSWPSPTNPHQGLIKGLLVISQHFSLNKALLNICFWGGVVLMGVCWGGPRRYFHIIMNVLARFAYMIHENTRTYICICMYVYIFIWK